MTNHELIFLHLQDMSFRDTDIGNLVDLSHMTNHEAVNMMLRVSSHVVERLPHPVEVIVSSTGDGVGTRVEAKFQRDKMWYVCRVGNVHGSVRDEEVSYTIDFDDGDRGRRVRREHVSLLEDQTLLNVNT